MATARYEDLKGEGKPYIYYWNEVLNEEWNSAETDRQPFIELCRDEGASAERSIALDYQSELAIKAPAKAFKLKHFMLGYSFDHTNTSVMKMGNVLLGRPISLLEDIPTAEASISSLSVTIVTCLGPACSVTYLHM